MSQLGFVVHGLPGPQGSKRNLGNGRMIESSKKVAPWRQDVKHAAERALEATPTWTFCHDGPVRVWCTFRFARPKHHYRTGRNSHLLREGAPPFPVSKTVHGDIDKLVRSSLDAVVAAGVLADDALVTELGQVRKIWCGPGEVPGATFLLEML